MRPVEAARDHTAAFDEVWVAVRSANSPARREAVRRTEAVAGTGRLRAEEVVFDSSLGPVRLARFVRTDAPPQAAPNPATRSTPASVANTRIRRL